MAGVAGEWWERVQARWLAWLGASPARAKGLLIVNLAAIVVVLVARAVIDRFDRGVDVWLACSLMLLGWLLLAPTKTLRWSSIFRLFSLTALWAFAIAFLCQRMAADLGLPVGSAGPSVAIAAVMEESLKLVPLAVIAFLAPGRARRFAATDWALLGLASGMGFQAAEDMVRRVALRPGTFSLFFERDDWRYGWTLFGGRFDSGHTASYAGHHIETALVAAAIGLAVRLGRRKGRRWLWAAPPALWLVVVADHAGLNATIADQAAFTSGRSTAPAYLHTLWSWTGHGFNRGWLLVGLLAVAVISDARAQTGRSGVAAPLHQLGSSWAAANGAYQAGPGPTPVRVANGLAALAAQRRGRELSAAPFSPSRPWLSTRALAGVAATLGVGLSALVARSLAVDIGPTLRSSRRAWFAGLLDALGDWWDAMGPGGHGLVVGAGVALLVLGALLLLPEAAAVAGGLVVTEGGVIVVGGTTAGTGAAAVTTILAGTGILTMAATGAQHPPSGGRLGRDDLSEADRKGLAEDPHLAELARDPAHGGSIDLKRLQEARIGRSLEDAGRLSRLRRDPTGGAEFIDEAGQAWDVKGYHSGFQNGYSLNKAMGDIRDSTRLNENVILDTTKMSPNHVSELRSAIAGDPVLSGKVIWWP